MSPLNPRQRVAEGHKRLIRRAEGVAPAVGKQRIIAKLNGRVAEGVERGASGHRAISSDVSIVEAGALQEAAQCGVRDPELVLAVEAPARFVHQPVRENTRVRK